MSSFSGVWSMSGTTTSPRFITGVSDQELDVIRELFSEWASKYPKNLERSLYRDMKIRIKPTGNIPQEAIARVEAVTDWPEKAVTALAERSVFEGFVAPGESQDPFELSAVLDANRFDIELPQAIDSTYTHSCAFITTARGDVQAGEPEVLVMAREALWSVALWDFRRRAVRAAMSITETDDHGEAIRADVFLPGVVISLMRRPSGSWVSDRRANPLGEVPVEPLTYKPSLARPFGHSRINRAVANITDRALLAIVRAELSSDFYAAPRMYALGVTEDAFSRGKWRAAIDSWFAISKDEDGDTPSVGQFPQMTMQPLNDHYRTIATQFSGATGVPVSNLGIVTDNPPSAEALYADDRRIVSTARTQNRIFGSALKRVAQRIVRLRDGGEVTPDLAQIDVAWANPAFTSPATSAAALAQLASVFPWLSESQVALEFAGFSQAEITRLMTDKSRYDARAFARALDTTQAGTIDEPSGSGEDELNQANVLKAKADALGVLRRAGVDADDAARLAGLDDVQFIPGQPITIKQADE